VQVTEARSAELQRVIALARQQGVASLSNLEMHAKLLQACCCFPCYARCV
jgi:hypothetical protein